MAYSEITDPIDLAAVDLCRAQMGYEHCHCANQRNSACDVLRTQVQLVAYRLGISGRQLEQISRGGKVSVRGGKQKESE